MQEPHHHGHYIHTVTYSYRERLVGAFVLAGALGLLSLVAINITSNHLLEKKILFQGYLTNGEGITGNTAVRIAGIDAGHVLSVGMTKTDKVLVKMFVYKRFQDRIHSNAVATLNRLSVLGAPTIDISPGTNNAPVLRDNATIKMRETPSVNEVMDEFAHLLYSGNPGQRDVLFADLAETLKNLKAITTRIRQGKGAAGTLVYDEEFNREMVGSVDSLNQVLAATSKRLAQMEPLLARSKVLLANLKTASAQLPDLVSQARGATAQARHTLTLLNTDMKTLPDFMVRTDLLLLNANELINAMENIWPVSSAVQRPQGKGLIRPQTAHE